MLQRNTNGKRQTFAIHAPGAMNVLLAGDFTHWQEQAIPLKQKRDGLWKTTVELPPGTYHYRFIVDGQWQDDPECPVAVDNPYGTHDAVLEIAAG